MCGAGASSSGSLINTSPGVSTPGELKSQPCLRHSHHCSGRPGAGSAGLLAEVPPGPLSSYSRLARRAALGWLVELRTAGSSSCARLARRATHDWLRFGESHADGSLETRPFMFVELRLQADEAVRPFMFVELRLQADEGVRPTLTNSHRITPTAHRSPAHRSRFSHPLVHPVVDRLVPELRILRLEHPMAFIGEVEHLRRHALALQGREQVESLRNVEPVIELAMHDQRRRLEIRGEQMRGPFPVHLAVRPRRTSELPFVEPQLFGRAPGRLSVEHAVVAHDALESVGVAEDPVGHVSAVAGAQRALAVFINEW